MPYLHRSALMGDPPRADDHHVTTLDLFWTVGFFVVAYLLLRLSWNIACEDFDPRRPMRHPLWCRAPWRLTAVAPAPVPIAVPRGLTIEEYAADGIRRLRVHLIQHARRHRL